MSRKRILATVALGLCVIAGALASKLFAFQSGRPIPSQPPTSTQPVNPPVTAGTQAWEYRILHYEIVNRFNQGPPGQLDYVERKINDAADQGFEVQSLQPVATQADTFEVIVLLRRPRK